MWPGDRDFLCATLWFLTGAIATALDVYKLAGFNIYILQRCPVQYLCWAWLYAPTNFRFLDGISHPPVKDFDTKPIPGQETVTQGVILCERENNVDACTSKLFVRPAWAFRGSFSIIPYLSQFVPHFNNFLKPSECPLHVLTAGLMGARLMGRWKGGPSSVTAILVQRFLIHLQLANRKALHVGTSQNAGSSQDSMGTLVFERVVGSLSASLTPDDYVSSTDVDSAMFSKSSDASDAGEGDVDDGRGKESIPLARVGPKI
ncbi:hypothetical protein GSI_07541 [Ganoderma sinense ZZ0214-1]|uniref:Uncharacterized protein n=1 Tax=Ganoderma sinense ZZ0214-1 TaxID=1077348 RepID=A0A2G8S9B5_9APHY|nr:hypothetical protein GSI_07541 [Ganoderma sinense ZZ0214-1]